ncbi:MAG: hypothetical protein E7019_00095 [Alphaproteobacteria bacterium]|nr:hypothetical protein [Alphaproteobacteria bacterium]
MSKRLKVVRRNKKFGVLTADGKEFLPFVYDKIFRDDVYDFFELHQNGMVSFCAYDGVEILIPTKEEDVYVNRQARMFEIKHKTKLLFYNFNGKKVLDEKYSSETIEAFRDGFVILSGDFCRFVNLKGEVVLSGFDQIYEVLDYNQNVLIVKKNGKYGVYDLAGNKIMPVRYDRIEINHGVCKGIDTVHLNLTAGY